MYYYQQLNFRQLSATKNLASAVQLTPDACTQGLREPLLVQVHKTLLQHSHRSPDGSGHCLHFQPRLKTPSSPTYWSSHRSQGKLSSALSCVCTAGVLSGLSGSRLDITVRGSPSSLWRGAPSFTFPLPGLHCLSCTHALYSTCHFPLASLLKFLEGRDAVCLLRPST